MSLSSALAAALALAVNVFGVTDNGAVGGATPSPPAAVSSSTAVSAQPAPPTPGPAVSAIAAQKVGPFSAVITWSTDEPADSTVSFGPQAIYGSTATDPAPLPQHVVALQQLTPGMTYHFRVLSQDTTGHTAVSADQTFTTPFSQDIPPGINLALGKTASASSTVRGAPSFVVDGNMNTGWSSRFSDSEYIMIDLGASYWIGGVVLSWLGANARVYQILVSQDGNAWTDAYDQNAGGGATESLKFAPTQARYVMMSGTKGATRYGYSLAEFEVISAAAPPATPAAGPTPADADPRAPQKFLTPATQDGVNDAANFGSSAQEVTIVDLRGRQVFKATRAGSNITWACRDGSGRIVESGVYVARIKTTDSKTVYQSFAVAK